MAKTVAATNPQRDMRSELLVRQDFLRDVHECMQSINELLNMHLGRELFHGLSKYRAGTAFATSAVL